MNNVLVLGSGGREHSLLWKLKQSNYVKNLYSIPGNGGISQDANVFNIDVRGRTIKNFVNEKNINFVVVGPEMPLVEGISDYLKDARIKVFGPSKKAAVLEGSKIFAKYFMKKYEIPTADFEVFDDYKKAVDYLNGRDDIVIKADGLCGGKGVFVVDDFAEGQKVLEDLMLNKIFGVAGSKIIIEEKLSGDEASILVLLSENNYTILLPSTDHKPVFDGNKGPNTGGMGAYAPTKIISAKILEKIKKKIIAPVIEGLKEEGIVYNGVLYIGLMVCKEDCNVLEFNVRFGDPETQAILPLMESDLFEVLSSVVDDRLSAVNWRDGVCVDVVLASKGYPGDYESGKLIEFKKGPLQDIFLFHAGTKYSDGKYYTAGGRVLNVAAVGKDISRQGRKFIRQYLIFILKECILEKI